MTFDEREYELLVYWIREREAIRIARAKGTEPPWSEDPIFRKYPFCNVRRADDRVSEWLRNEWYTQSYESAPRTLVIAALLARNINWPETLAEIGYPSKWNPRAVRSKLKRREQQGKKIFTGAYLINGARGGSKIDQVITNIHSAACKMDRNGEPYLHPDSMWSSWRALQTIPGQGSFMAGQVIADIRWYLHFPDSMLFAPLGPGSRRGMNRVLGREIRAPMNQSSFTHHMNRLVLPLQRDVYGIFKDRALEAMDIQNCLCEFDKYRRIETGDKRMKRIFRPTLL